MPNVYIVDDHALIRDGLQSMLQSVEDITVAGMSGEIENALENIPQLDVDVVIMDYNLKSIKGNEAIKMIKKNHSHLKFMALTSYAEKGVVTSMVKAGAQSFVLKESNKEELVEAIRTTAQDNSWFPKEIAQILLSDLLAGSSNQKRRRSPTGCVPSSLTEREKEVLRLITDEKTTKEIAVELHISPKTVENHRTNLLQKIGARNIVGLAKYAIFHSLDI